MANELILLVEDNVKNRKLARFILNAKGFRTVEADSAETGLALVQQESPDLVLMDVSLPGMNGIDALQRLREEPGTARIPVVAFTAFAMKEDRHRFMRAGFDGYLTKPIEARTFGDQVRELCDQLCGGR
jgi:two-component system, cell cycle response regulator DivK